MLSAKNDDTQKNRNSRLCEWKDVTSNRIKVNATKVVQDGKGDLLRIVQMIEIWPLPNGTCANQEKELAIS